MAVDNYYILNTFEHYLREIVPWMLCIFLNKMYTANLVTTTRKFGDAPIFLSYRNMHFHMKNMKTFGNGV